MTQSCPAVLLQSNDRCVSIPESAATGKRSKNLQSVSVLTSGMLKANVVSDRVSNVDLSRFSGPQPSRFKLVKLHASCSSLSVKNCIVSRTVRRWQICATRELGKNASFTRRRFIFVHVHPSARPK